MQKEPEDYIALNLLLNKTCHTCIENKIFDSYGNVISCEYLNEQEKTYNIKYSIEHKTCQHWRDRMTVGEIMEREG